jgi:hypothetical protein
MRLVVQTGLPGQVEYDGAEFERRSQCRCPPLERAGQAFAKRTKSQRTGIGTQPEDVAPVLMAVFLHDIDLLGPFQAQIWLGVNVKIAFNTLVRDN